MNLQDRDVELNWREVTCKRAVNGPNFERGIQDYDFSVSGKNAFIPSLSYFVIDATLTVNATKVSSIINDVSNVIDPEAAALIRVSGPAQGVANAVPTAYFRRPSVADGIAFADHFGSTLYNNAFFRAGNSDVSLITQYIPQAGVLKSRLDKSFAWSKSIGRIVTQDDADFERRRNYVSLDGKFHDDGLKPLQYSSRVLLTQFGNVVPDYTQNWKVGFNPDTGILTMSGTTNGGTIPAATVINLYTVGIQVNDIVNIRLAGADRYFQITGFIGSPPLVVDSYNVGPGPEWTYRVVEVRGGDNSPIVLPLANEDPNATFAVKAARDPACGANRSQIMFQPPIGIFSEANAISGGDFKISLNPSPNYKINGVQSLRALQPYSSAQLPQDYDLVINDVKFYVATIKSDVSPTGTIPLTLVEMAVLNKTLNPSAGSQNLDFTVPPSTLAITVFVQGANAGTNTCIPSSKFYLQTGTGDPAIISGSSVSGLNDSLINNVANNIQQIQVTYGSVTKTQTLYNSSFNLDAVEGGVPVGINQNVQRFLQSIQYSGRITSEGGSECQPQYLERGNYWHFDFSKDKNDTSSYVNVQIGFNETIAPGNNLFIVAHYSRQCEIAYENGFITQVVSVNR